MNENGDDLHPPLSRRQLPREIEFARVRADVGFREGEAQLEDSILAHVAAYADELDRVIDLHRNIGDNSDLPIGTDTRWSAIWELAGKCLAEARLLVYAAAGGYTVEASANVRAMLEAMDLLMAIEFDDNVLRRWLAGKDVRPKKARSIVAQRQKLAAKNMLALGLDPGTPDMSAGEWLYVHFSEAAHHRRGPITRSISLSLRTFAYGPHPNPHRRGRELNDIGHLLETALMVVIAALGRIVGPQGLREILTDMATRLNTVRVEYPLSEDEPVGDGFGGHTST